MRRRAVVVAARRTPIGRIGGALRRLTVETLAAVVLRAVLKDAGVAACEVDDVILGNAAGPGGNPARVALLAAGFPIEVPGVTIDRQCGSGLEAVILGARLIEAGAAEVIIAGGVESVSTAPWRIERPKSLYATPRIFGRAPFAPETIGDPEMGAAAENVARQFGITRRRQDAYALASHRKAVAAQAAGRFTREIVSLDDGGGKIVDADECPRPDASMAALEKLSPAFEAGGTVTAGNACPLNDGAAAVLLMSEERAAAEGRRRWLRFAGAAAEGVDPNLLGTGPIASTRRLLARTPELSIDDIDRIEFNEAFAAQVLACFDALGIAEHRVNPAGGAIALGHPFGASGAILVTRLFSDATRDDGSYERWSVATLGIGGGMGLTALFERCP